ncbi:MAG: S-adenosylmethionine-diacylglycerol 3-amino-3-carboxypropyl transferase [Kiritimatiellia bacterium]|jgi:S-adenosylmethionine-diacylglycerol 3-amino-3-carboxypropyl transferase
MALRDKIFQTTFSKLFVYNILWEDAEIDEKFLGVDESSAILGITGAGCGMAGLMAGRPQRIDCVDINPHHLSLAALKITAAQRMESHSQFYDLFARGWASDPQRTVSRLADTLPRWMQRYWKRHHDRFDKSMLRQGLTAQMLHAFRRQVGVDADWLRQIMREPVEERHRAIDEWIRPVLYKRHVKAILSSPLQLVSLGINFQQRDRLLETEGLDIVEFFIEHLKRVAATDVETNWFVWYTVAGEMNHDNPDAVPPYLRKSRWEKSFQAPTTTRYHNRNLFEVLGQAGPRTWSHYTLCDAPDWLPDPAQKHLLDEILRTSRDGAVVLARSVEGHGIVENCQYEKHFIPMTEESEYATLHDRSKQYRRVSFYRVAH